MLTVRTVAHRVRIAAAWGSLRERELLHVRLDFEDGTYGEGEAAPLEPYDGVPLAAVRRRSTPTRCSTRRLTSCSRRAGPSATCPRRSPRSTSRCGTAGPPPRRPVAELISPDALDAIRVNATIGAEDRAGAAEAAAAAAQRASPA